MTEKKIDNVSNAKLLSKDDAINVLEFANSIYNYTSSAYTNSDLLNQILNNLQNNPIVPTTNGLKEALKDYKHNAKTLQSYSEYAEVYDSLYGRTINYYAGLLAFDLQIHCINAYSPKEDYKSEEYKKDLRRVYKFFDNFNYKEEFHKVLENLIRSEVYFTWLRDSKGSFNTNDDILDDSKKGLNSYTLQPMPQDSCQITAIWEKGYLYNIDMNYFNQYGVDIKSYDNSLQKYWKELRNGTNKDIDYDKRTSPDDGAWVFKFSSSNLNETPFLSSLIKDVLTNDEISKLQNNANIASARGLLVGQIPMMNKQKSGQTQDAMAWSPARLQQFMSLVKMGLSDCVNAVAMPTEENDFYQFENKNPDMLRNQLRITAGNGASASRILYNDDRASKDELEAQIMNDYNLVKRVYNQFNNFLNFYVNKKTRKYKFSFNLHGCTYPFIREMEKKSLMELADKGIVLNSSVYSGVVGMTPQDFDRSLEEARYGDFTDKLTMLFSIHTQSGKTPQDKGAPKKDDTEISENGAISREYE